MYLPLLYMCNRYKAYKGMILHDYINMSHGANYLFIAQYHDDVIQ